MATYRRLRVPLDYHRTVFARDIAQRVAATLSTSAIRTKRQCMLSHGLIGAVRLHTGARAGCRAEIEGDQHACDIDLRMAHAF
jgi:hypothetical protein